MSRIVVMFSVLVIAALPGCGQNPASPEIVNEGDSWNFDSGLTDTSNSEDGYDDIVDDAETRIPDSDVAIDAANEIGQDANPSPASMELIPDILDFAYYPKTQKVERVLTIRNTGDLPLEVSSITIVADPQSGAGGRFELVGDPLFAPTTNSGTGYVPGGGFVSVRVNFVREGPADGGLILGTLSIESNSTDGPAEVPLRAQAIQGACRLQVIPSKINFGTVATGFRDTVEVRLVNTGTFECRVKKALISDCSWAITRFSCPDPLSGGESDSFSITEDVKNTVVQSGSQKSLTVEFIPPDQSGPFTSDRFRALLSLEVEDTNNGTSYVIPECESAGCEPNVIADISDARAAVQPDSIDFGIVPTICGAATAEVCLFNYGTADLGVQSTDLIGCSDEFSTAGLTGTPVSVPAGGSRCFNVEYSPSGAGTDSCRLEIGVTDLLNPMLTVDLTGAGAVTASYSDIFQNVTGEPVDLLFVIDDSGSMCEEQDRLADAIKSFLGTSGASGKDFHIGAINVDSTTAGVAGYLNRGNASVIPRFLSPTDYSDSRFKSVAAMGCDGASIAQEAGLEAAMRALSAPLAFDTGAACQTDTDCYANPSVCPEGYSCAFSCVAGFCGGFNRGFLRPDAALEMVILSDEDDQSVNDPGYYVDFLSSLKPDGKRVRVNAIIGVKGVPAGPGESGDCVSPDGGGAMHASRYIEAVAATGGVYSSICQPDFKPAAQQIGASVFRPRLSYGLTQTAEPGTVSLQINSATCSRDWSFDEQTNSIVFVEGGRCTPKPGDTLKVTYDIACAE